MASVGLAEADLLQAGTLPNPTLPMLFPAGPKPLEFAVKYPVEAIWLRPKRLEIAKLMLISHYKHLQDEEGVEFGLPLILRGAEERLAPILMTACCAGLALLPLIIGGNLPGHEIEYPMAVVIVGGLVTSTLLNLFLMPALFAAFGRKGGLAAARKP